MRRGAAFAWVLLFLWGCGGGGSGPASQTVTGLIVDASNGGAPSPAAQVEAGTSGVTTLTDANGNFSLNVPGGTNLLRVDRRDGSSLFLFAIPVPTASEDVGTLWIGASKVTATGTVVDAVTSQPIPSATVDLGGVIGTSKADGTFSISGVAYDGSVSSDFSNLPITVTAKNYISASTAMGSNSGSTGTVALGDILMIPLSGSTPPSSPYNIWGKVGPIASSPGTTVTLNSGGAPIRGTTVDSNGLYFFWVPAGSYTVTFTQTGFASQTVPVTLAESNVIVEKDVTLAP